MEPRIKWVAINFKYFFIHRCKREFSSQLRVIVIAAKRFM